MNQTLLDATPIVAICDDKQIDSHRLCVEIYKSISGSFVTTLPCLTEAMYLLYRERGWQGQSKLWELLAQENIEIQDFIDVELSHMKELMEKYNDTPMDFADASLVVAAESLGIKRIFTLDSDFYVYRINDTESFEVIP